MKHLLKLFVANMLFVLATFSFAAQKHSIVLEVSPGCGYCAEAKRYLDEHHITYKAVISRGGRVPRLYVDGKYIGTGSDVVESWVQKNSQ